VSAPVGRCTTLETMSDAARLLTLEEKVAYQDKTIAELNDVVTDLNRLVATLTSRLADLERLFGAELSRREMPNEKPPHY
jgi:SlyX protein